MKIFILVITLLLCANNAYCEIYKWVDKQGKAHFGDRKPEKIDVETLELKINTYTSVTYDVSIFDTGKKVVMYSTDWCGFCKKARNYFKKNNITYTEYDIEKDVNAKRRYKAMGARGIPVIIVGKKRMNGFSADGFGRIYQ